MAFKMSQLFSVHDGDMLAGVLSKKYYQKNARSAFIEKKKNLRHVFRRVGSHI